MTTHMKELIEHAYVYADKAFVDNKPRTTYSLTVSGQIAFNQYVQSLKEIIFQD